MLAFLAKNSPFPPVSEADEEGLLALGGDLNPQRLVNAYRLGIFPWYSEGSPILWWSPNPRFVLFPQKLVVSHSMKRVLTSGKFQYRYNTAFPDVIKACSKIFRKGQDGTWIIPEVVHAYNQLHQLGLAISAETLMDGKLVGGLYGVRMGNVFFGESMFAKASDASKYAFILLVKQLQSEGVVLVDCQTHTNHLESLGAEMIPRDLFCKLLDSAIGDYPFPV